ncbi:UDP-N-acetylmuramoyl-L-alanyl-D-glutamate--2,6-diaminopimelate ligase [cf. Phormidesmis sp. LEGE 11477]|uniref:UDP-N-acetylmuramoyl-L-alanyl-D-glutamate--2, 6-diaminopimelate ligase n=1 Tax=cf. Phormidesmis sp. LEGE 11477 TaxID=1828680 RepID=UPI0018818D2B|nr:UDP-N-acetylmuramoyl-L-alanyl-D-glutamate--2,6-diaminopimelate ligase [cf. Phormidesmis sp. LEGE 11477]MBE9060088.1 UDP-N-acetylmuramoyl-L-alanyl-D-glutamate--2,6-diaminopimelate ligase [cf. Phormidesmis sp. LEGE 11477]
MLLRDLFTGLEASGLEDFQIPEPIADHPNWSKAVTGLSTNSQAIKPGMVFVGMPGTRVDGGEFWQSAIDKGAIAALVSPSALDSKPNPDGALVLTTSEIARNCAELAATFYAQPAKAMNLVGVTGTNGKTTTTHLIEYFLNQAQQKTAILGTLYTRWPGYEKVAVHTTPFSIDLQAELASARQADCQNVVMEVSSHALAQERTWGIPFEVAVFTNLTQDHLDYHKDFNDYFEAKALLFSGDYLKARAIINQKDPYGQKLIERVGKDRALTYDITDSSADLYTSGLEYSPTGVSGTLHTSAGDASFTSPLVGQFNLENLLAAVGAALHLGVSLDQIVTALPQFTGVPGRMERVQILTADMPEQDIAEQNGSEQDISVIVDYAHTPDSLENALKAARPFVNGRLICVFGCGGDRDRTKRPKMGRIAYEQSDLAIVTSDNPRTESPEQILKDVVAGIDGPLDEKQVIGDRAAAIRSAILSAQPGDGIVIAGKGHEDYQILGTEKIHFDDREHARAALEERLRTR